MAYYVFMTEHNIRYILTSSDVLMQQCHFK